MADQIGNVVRFGLFCAPFHSRKLNPTVAFQHDLNLVALADQLGYDEVWFGEHHSGAMEMSGAPELMIAMAAERTKRIRLGAGVKSIPYHNPFILAELMVQLDHMTMGRTMFGVGPGALPSDAAMLGIDPAETRRRMEEGVEVILRLFDGECVTAETDWFKLVNARLQLDPFTKPRMEMAVTAIRSPAGVMLAGKHGLGVLSLGGTSEKALEIYNTNWGVCEETAKLYGRVADRHGFRVTIQIHLAESRERAVNDLAFGFDEWAQYAKDILPFGPIPKDVERPLGFVLENRGAVVGTPDDAIEHLEYVQAGSGGFGVILIMVNDWASPEATRRSLDLFARHVVPHFQDQHRARQEAYDNANRARDRSLEAAARGVENAQARLTEQRAKGS